MVLGFKTEIGGKPTYFVHKIWIGLDRNKELLGDKAALYSAHHKYFVRCVDDGLCYPDWSADSPKIHTIRADTKNRWRVGMPIHFVIKNRTPNRFQFAPILPVKAIQEIEIDWHEAMPIVFIGGEHFYMPIGGIDKGMAQLAKNDGFDSVDDFFAYFNSYFKGKIIHWTDEKYCIDDSSQMNEHAYEEAISGVQDDQPGFNFVRHKTRVFKVGDRVCFLGQHDGVITKKGTVMLDEGMELLNVLFEQPHKLKKIHLKK